MQCDINYFGTGTLVRAMCSMLQRSILHEQQPRKMWQRTLMIFCSSLMVSIVVWILVFDNILSKFTICKLQLKLCNHDYIQIYLTNNACKYRRYNSIIKIYEVHITIISSFLFLKLLLYIFCIHVILFLGVFFPATSAEERESVCSVVNVVKSHANTLETFRENHSGQAASIEHRACETFQQDYMVGYFVVK